MIESWMVSLGLAIVTFIAIFVTNKNKVDLIQRESETLKSQLSAAHKRAEAQGDAIIALNTKSELAMTAKDVDDKYVSKEMFSQMQKNFDNKLDATEKHLIDKVDTMGKSIERTLAQVLTNQMSLSSKLESGKNKTIGD